MTEMLQILKKTIFNLNYSKTNLRYHNDNRPNKCPTILYGVNL